MPGHSRHDRPEAHFLALLGDAGPPRPDELAHLRHFPIFLWEAPKSVVLIDLTRAG